MSASPESGHKPDMFSNAELKLSINTSELSKAHSTEFYGLSPKERKSQVAEIRFGIEESDLDYIMAWSEDPLTRGHLDPPPRVPDWTDEQDVIAARSELAEYYNNEGEPHKIQPMVAVNYYGEPIGALTIRWKGDATAPPDKRIASIERFIVDPDHQGGGIGRTLLDAALEHAFNEYKGYKNGQGAREVRAWVMTDKEAGDYSKNLNLFFRPGFTFVQDRRVRWSEYQQAANFHEDQRSEREGIWLKLNKEDWLEKKQQNQQMQAE